MVVHFGDYNKYSSWVRVESCKVLKVGVFQEENIRHFFFVQNFYFSLLRKLVDMILFIFRFSIRQWLFKERKFSNDSEKKADAVKIW